MSRPASRSQSLLTVTAWFVLIACVCAFSGCAGQAELDLIYSKSASHHSPDRNPIVVIPGIMGSSLLDTASGAVVWGAFDGNYVNPTSPDGARLLALPFDAGDDDVEATGVLDRIKIRLAGIPLELEVYAQILVTLGAVGYRDSDLGTAGEVDYGDDHFTCFQFAYDWRKDNVENAARLHAFLKEKREYVREKYREHYGIDKADVKFDIVAHSMGSLVTRYFLRYGDQDLPDDGSVPEPNWAGAELAERVVLVAPPNAGSLDALVSLVEGRRLGPTLPHYSPAILGTFPSMYQVLPRGRHQRVVWEDTGEPIEDPLDHALWQSLGWGVADPEMDEYLGMLMPEVADSDARLSLALATQQRLLGRAKTFMAALDRKAEAPEGLEVYLIAGDATATPRQVSVNRDSGQLQVVDFAPGDGTVLRSSVLLDEREGQEWQPTLSTPIDYRSVLLLPESHFGITKNAAFRDNMLFWLLEEPR
jgi:pimeloyl-ACP methyl ester carboxylesterase